MACRRTEEYVRRPNKEIVGLLLPDLKRAKTIIGVHPSAVWVKDDLISIDFLIPLVCREQFSHDMVITIPDSRNLTWGTATRF